MSLQPPGSIGDGFRLPLRAAHLLLELPHVKRVAVLPVVMNALIYLAVMGGALWWIGHWDWQLSGEPWQFWGPVGGWLHAAIDHSLNVLKWLVALPALFFFCYFTFTAVGMVVASPFNDLLSERIERALCVPLERPRLSWKVQAKLMLISLGDSLLILLRQVGWTLLVLPCLIIPYIGFIPLFLVTAYHTGLGFVDVAMARNGLRHRHKQILNRVHRRQLLGIGLAMELMFLIPFMGLFILPLGVVAGTLLYCRFDWEERLRVLKLEPPPHFVYPRLRSP